jgi:hypothetical protein
MEYFQNLLILKRSGFFFLLFDGNVIFDFGSKRLWFGELSFVCLQINVFAVTRLP